MSQSWLKDLEDKVHAASKSLRTLREENDELKAQVKDLEDQLDGRSADGAGEEEAAWQEERDEIKDRVEKLADHLAELLGEG